MSNIKNSMEVMLHEDATNERNFASRYIVDVSIAPTYIMLGDSSRVKYYIDAANKDCIKTFEEWFKNIFSVGIPGKLIIFEYQRVAHEGQFVNVISKILSSSLSVQSQTA